MPFRPFVIALLLAAGLLAGCADRGEDAPDPVGPVAEGDGPMDLPVVPAPDGGAPVIEAVATLEGGGRYGSTAVWTGSTFLVLGGYDGDEALGDILGYKPGDATAALLGQLPDPTWDASAVWDGSQAVQFGGGAPEGGVSDAIVAVDAASGESSIVGRLPGGRSSTSAAGPAGSALIFGGTEMHGHEVLRYQAPVPAVAVQPAVLPSARIGTAAVVHGDAIYVLGGKTQGTPIEQPARDRLDEILRVDPATGQATLVGQLPTPRGFGTAVSDGEAIYYFGGNNGSHPTDEIVRFDPSSGEAVLLATRLPYAVSSVAGATDGTHAYLFGGGAPEGPSPYVLRIDLARLA